jgi:cyclohexadieny/prephenate dehydrogenase
MKIDTLTIVGVGLIGGSIGLAAKRRGLVGRIHGVGRTQDNLDVALRAGAIDSGSLDLVDKMEQADLVVFCTPVDRIAEQVLAAAPCCKPGALLTDAGSTKAEIVRRVENDLPARVSFVGSHPLAGSEKRGAEYADAGLFQNRLAVVTPTPRTKAEAVTHTRAFWEALGSRVKVMSPEDHDRALAFTSHVPHLLASALAGALPADLFELTATGFRDTTRVAAGDPELWTAIFAANRTAMLDALSSVSGRLDEFRRAIDTRDWTTIDALLAHARKVRHALGS